MEISQRIGELEEVLLGKHPDWSQEKAKWIAKQALGIANWR